MIFVVVHLQPAAQDVNRSGNPIFEVVTEMKVLAVTGPVLHHARLTVTGFPAVVAAQARGVAVTDITPSA
jgi:predicted phosphohydrolase